MSFPTSGSFRKKAGTGAGVTAVGGCRHEERVKGGGLNPGERSPQSVGNRRMGGLESQVRAFSLDVTENAVVGNSYAAINLFRRSGGKLWGLESGRPGTRFWLCHLLCEQANRFLN